MASEGPLEEMTNSAIAGLPDKAREPINEALHGGIDSMTAIKQGLKPGMDSAEEAFPRGDVFIPDLVLAREAMKAAVANLEPAGQMSRGWRPGLSE